MRTKWLNTLVIAGLLAGSALLPAAASAQDGLQIDVSTEVVCDTASFDITVTGGSGSHDVTIEDYGDGDTDAFLGTSAYPLEVDHAYSDVGEYAWSILAVDSADAAVSGSASGTVAISGPTVELTSDPFPPLLYLDGGSAEITFEAVVDGNGPFTYEWDLDEDGLPDNGTESTATNSYSEPGKYQVTVTVTDNCGFSATDTLAVVVFDSEDACHPMAQRIAEAVSSIFPDRAEQLYSCEGIFGIFRGDLTGGVLGFGRMWQAYRLTERVEELTWEEILDWHLNQGGWGLLMQLDRYSDTLADVGIRDLYDMISNDEATMREVLSAARTASRHDADFETVLGMIQSGAKNGEINQALKLADEDTSAEEILEMGLQEYRASVREGREQQRLADRYGLTQEEIEAIYDDCDGNKKCIREQLRSLDASSSDRPSRDERTAQQLSRQYGVPEESVWNLYNGTCGGDWKCVRTTLRDQSR